MLPIIAASTPALAQASFGSSQLWLKPVSAPMKRPNPDGGEGVSKRSRTLAPLVASFRGSGSAVYDLVRKLKDQPEVMEDLTKWKVRRAHEEFAAAFLDAPIELKLVRGGHFDMPVTDFASLLQHCVSESESFKRLMSTTFSKSPCSPSTPWDFILYFDEFTPGNVLRQDNKRKALAFYASFRTFGPAAVSSEDAWLPIAFIRHTMVDKVSGKMSAVVRQLLRRLFIGSDSASQRGILIDGIGPGGAPALIFFKLSNLLYDEDGAKQALCLKGAAGVVPCALCKNVHGIYDATETLLAAHDATGTMVPISCADPNLFDARSAGDLWFSADLLQRLKSTLPKDAFEEQCKMHGVNHVPDGLILDAELRQHVSLDMHTYDPAHCMIINGIAQIELSELLCRLAAVGLTLERFRDVASAQWKTCSACGPLDANGLFSDGRQKHLQSKKKHSAKASEMIAAIPLIRYALDVLTDGSAQFKHDFAQELASFTALAKCVSLYLEAKRRPDVADAWAVALRDHAMLFERAYGDCCMYIPKFHFCRHLPRQVVRDGFAVDTLVTERYHKKSLAISEHIDNTRCFEKSVLVRSVAIHCSNVQEKAHSFGNCLVDGVSYNEVMNVSRVVVIGGSRIRAGDILCFGGGRYFIIGGAEEGGNVALIACALHFVCQVTPSASRWRKDDAPRFVHCESYRAQALWTEEASGTFLLVDMA